ncbi:IS3 family transposase [Saccharothrix syringae]|uniref:Transposase n=1 Tax=Saccharothrix syringae TaxID=103733 RepID=A0A5Q0GXQ6_SACSY|nr:transposase [Saccharothrix syringae]
MWRPAHDRRVGGAAHAAAVEFVLRVLGVASSTYHGWVARQAGPSDREREDRAITAEIVDIHTASGGTYGSPRIHQVLRHRGIRVSRKRVERLMRQAALQGAFLRKHWRTPLTRRDPRSAPARAPSGSRPCATPLQPDRGLEDQRPLRHRPRARRPGIRIWSRDVREGQLIHHSDRRSSHGRCAPRALSGRRMGCAPVKRSGSPDWAGRFRRHHQPLLP